MPAKKTTPKTKNSLSVIKSTLSRLLDLLGIEAEITASQEGETVNLQIETDKSGLLIGYHGETLNALQLITALTSFRQLNQWPKIVIEIGDYRKKRQESLSSLAQSTALQVKTTGLPHALPPMPSFERRLIHLALADDPDIETVSEGEQDRHVVIKLKTAT